MAAKARTLSLAEALDAGTAGLPAVHAHLDRVLAEAQAGLDSCPFDPDQLVNHQGPLLRLVQEHAPR